MRVLHAITALTVLAAPAIAAPGKLPAAIYTDPAPDAANPARMVVIHVPSGGVELNGIAYLAAGKGPHPTVILFHGLPGNEKNLDLAQAIRRAGWNVVTINYRGTWGSPGSYRFAGNLEDGAATLAWVRANAAQFRIDPRRIVLAGHSMGGWVTAFTAARDRPALGPPLLGAVMISAGNIGKVGKTVPRAEAPARWIDNGLETLADTSAEAMADEVIANADAFDFVGAAPGLAKTRLLVLTSDDGLKPHSDDLVAAIRTAGGVRARPVHVATDHGWSDARIRLQTEVIDWLATLRS